MPLSGTSAKNRERDILGLRRRLHRETKLHSTEVDSVPTLQCKRGIGGCEREALSWSCALSANIGKKGDFIGLKGCKRLRTAQSRRWCH